MQTAIGILRSIGRAIGQLWNKGCIGKVIVGFLALIVIGICGAPFRGASSSAPAVTSAPVVAQAATAAPTHTANPVPTDAPATTDMPTAEVLAQLATDAPTAALIEPTAAPVATRAPAPIATPAPTAAPVVAQPTKALVPVVASGTAPQGSACPADHPIKGNIRDRNPNKGEKIYHLPGDNGYAQTKPERCFADAAEAEAAGFRPVK
jgi:hypothetical protein